MFQRLPGLPELYLDYLSDSPRVRQLLPRRPSPETLLEHAGRIHRRALDQAPWLALVHGQALGGEEIQPALAALDDSGMSRPVAVLSFHRARVLGGPVSVLAKVMSTLRLAGRLVERGVPALPVCCVTAGSQEDGWEDSLGFIDGCGAFREHTVRLERRIPADCDRLLDVLSHSSGRENPESRFIALARKSYAPGASVTAAWREFVSGLCEPRALWTLDLDSPGFQELTQGAEEPLCDHAGAAWRRWIGRVRLAGYDARAGGTWSPAPDCNDTQRPPPFIPLRLCFQLPVAAVVVDPDELGIWGGICAVLDDSGATPPQIWPRVSFTVIDPRSRKLLARYGATFDDLLEGAEHLRNRALMPDAVRRVAEVLGNLQEDTGRLGAQIGLALGSGRARSAKAAKSLYRVQYQLDRLRERGVRHHQRRSEVLQRQFGAVCDRLLPRGRLQESLLAALWLLAVSSAAAVDRLLAAADPFSFEHQLIDLDTL